MKKRLSHLPYNERSRLGWTLSTPLPLTSRPIRSTIKTVTHVPGTFVTLVSGPYREDEGGDHDFLYSFSKNPSRISRSTMLLS